MELNTAIKLMKTYLRLNDYRHDFKTAIETVLKGLDDRYSKGFADGYKQGKFDVEMDNMYRNQDNV